MFYILYFVACAVVWLAYVVGKSEGRRAANRSATDHGTWVEVVKPIKASVHIGESPRVVSPGIQGIVSGVDKWSLFRRDRFPIGVWSRSAMIIALSH